MTNRVIYNNVELDDVEIKIHSPYPLAFDQPATPRRGARLLAVLSQPFTLWRAGYGFALTQKRVNKVMIKRSKKYKEQHHGE